MHAVNNDDQSASTNLAPYEALAQQLSAAYTAGDAMTIREINWRKGTSFVWDRDPEQMKQRLPNWFAATNRTTALALADGRLMIAKAHGFTSWEQFAERVRHPVVYTEAPASGISSTPPFYKIDWKSKTMMMRGLIIEKDWDIVFAIMREHQLTGLTSPAITNKAMQGLTQLTHVTRLNLEGAVNLTDEGLRQLAYMPQLQELDLGGWHSPLTDKGLTVLQALPGLKRFHLYWAQRVSDAGMAHLSSCNQLESVDLLGSTVGDGAVKALTGKPDLRRFKTGKQVTDAGLAMLQQLPVFSTWQGHKPSYGLMSYDAEPNHLMIDGPFTDRGLIHLQQLNGLFGLSFFWHSNAFTSKGLGALATLPHLGFLGCEGERCNDEAMQQISRFPHLRMLMAQGTVASDEGFAALSTSKSLEYLWGRECPNLTGKGFKLLAHLPNLRGLAVSCKGVDMEALSLLPSFPALREFMPVDVQDEGFHYLGKCRQLEALWCMYCRDTTDVATSYITALPHLKTYYAGDTQITDHSMELLSHMQWLQNCTLWSLRHVTNAGIAALARLPRLQNISLEGLPNVTPEVVTLFPAGVQVNYS